MANKDEQGEAERLRVGAHVSAGKRGLTRPADTLRQMPVDPCEERHSLSLRVYVAVEALYEAKERYESAKERKAANVSELSKLLNEARTAELELATALREHIESHGCLH